MVGCRFGRFGRTRWYDWLALARTIFPATYISCSSSLSSLLLRLLQWCGVYGIAWAIVLSVSTVFASVSVVWWVYCWFLQKCFDWDTMAQSTNRKPYDDDHNDDMRTLCNCQLDNYSLLITATTRDFKPLQHFDVCKWKMIELRKQKSNLLSIMLLYCTQISADFLLLFPFVYVGPIHVLLTPTGKCCVLAFRPIKWGYKIDE